MHASVEMSADVKMKILEFGVGRRTPLDPFFSCGNSSCRMLRRLGVYDVDLEELCHKMVANLVCEFPGCGTILNSVMELELHYNSTHRYVCATCHKTISSAHLLDLHIDENHDSYFAVQAERKPMYRCLVEDCTQRFCTSEDRNKHCIEVHNYPSNFRSAPSKTRNRNKRGGNSKKKTTSTAEMDITDLKEDSLSMDICESTATKNPTNPSHPSQKPIRGIVFGRGNTQKSFDSKYKKGRDWHKGISSVVNPGSALEDPQLSSELRESLPDESMN